MPPYNAVLAYDRSLRKSERYS